ncbi:MAG: hypothetical protein PHH77_01690 [Victivallaceae bacterium]|nr:hypothetical protein [Victivallaceae bacterium]
MLKRALIISAAVAAAGCFAASGIKIELNGTDDKIELKPGKADQGLTVVNADSKYCLTVASALNLPDKWQKYSFSFTPNKEGIVSIHFCAPSSKPQGDKTDITFWTAYDNITITGTEAKNCDFEFVGQNNLFDGWSGNPANMVTGMEDAQSGKNYIVVWHNNPVYQTLKVKPGQPVTVTFYAKTSSGPVKK